MWRLVGREEMKDMKKVMDAHLRRYRMLLGSIDAKGSEAEVIWRSSKIGSWEGISARWWETGGRMRFRFNALQKGSLFWISSVKQTAEGLKIFLSDPRRFLPEVLQIVWRRALHEVVPYSEDAWKLAQRWLRQRFPGFQILSASRRPDLARSLSGAFLRVLFRAHGKDHLALIADPAAENETARSALTQAMLCLSASGRRHRVQEIPDVFLLVPARHAAILYHRVRFLNPERIRAEVWEFDAGNAGEGRLRRASCPPAPVEERDFRWPVLGPFRWSTQLAKVLDLAPDFIRRYPRFQDYDSLRLSGLEFAQVIGSDRDRVCYGVGAQRTELSKDNFSGLCALVDEILFYRRADSPDTQHPYYRAQAERWLEALILEQVSVLFPELAPESVYPQIPVYLGKDPARVDILGADRRGNLVVMELKVSEDPDLPLQSLDYWGRVIQHNLNGDFERRGYFSGIRLSRGIPKIYLVSPVFSFHDSTERILRFLDSNLEVWKIAVNEDWRCGVKILRRTRLRCGDLA
jgi:hypothetical protein